MVAHASTVNMMSTTMTATMKKSLLEHFSVGAAVDVTIAGGVWCDVTLMHRKC